MPMEIPLGLGRLLMKIKKVTLLVLLNLPVLVLALGLVPGEVEGMMVAKDALRQVLG